MAKEKEITAAKTTLKSGIEKALQGLAFWISHRQIRHYRQPLNEGALVVEFVDLLEARLGKEFKVYCEKQCDTLRNERMDVEIKRGDLRVAAIEFKRILAGKASIFDDMKKLAKLKNKDVSRFLVVVSENKRPTKYVDKDGNAIEGDLNQKGKGDFSARIRRVLKSTASFGKAGKKLPNANYCCLIEVLPSKT